MITTHSATRLRRSCRMTATSAAVAALLAMAAPAHAAPTQTTEAFDFDANDLCPFTVHLAVYNEITSTTQATPNGTLEIDYVVETDTVSANGITLQGLPYHYTVHRLSDANGDPISLTAQGEIWRFRLPDGRVWSAGGHADWLVDEHNGSWTPSEGLGPVCDALAH